MGKKYYFCIMKQTIYDNAQMPRIAIIDPNILAVVGIRAILQDVMPIIEVDTFGSFAELQANHPEHYFHYFVAMNIVIENRAFFVDKRMKTIVLTSSNDVSAFSEFHCLQINVSESVLLKSILTLEQHAHGRGQNLPSMPSQQIEHLLSSREVEVLSLVAQGMINKEIAEKLNISITTVISHRKNIQDKLGVKSVSALTIYAVMHGFVDVNKI